MTIWLIIKQAKIYGYDYTDGQGYMIVLDGDKSAEHAKHFVENVRQGQTNWLRMVSDDYIKRYASQQDYEFWMSEKKRLSES